MSLKIIAIFTIILSVLDINCSVVPVAPALKYILVAPQNIRPFSAQVSTFTKGLNVLDAPLAAGVLNPPAIFSRTVSLPSPIAAPAAVLSAHAHEAFLPAPLSAPAPFSTHLGGLPGIGEPSIPVPLGSLPSSSFVPLPQPFSPYGHFHGPAAPIAAAPPAHVLPFPNARSIHAVAPAPVVEPGVW